MTVILYICALTSNLLKNSIEFTLLQSPLQLKQPLKVFLKTLLNCFVFYSFCKELRSVLRKVIGNNSLQIKVVLVQGTLQ